MSKSIFLRQVTLMNYKSIAGCKVQLGPLNFFVGPNGAGKSNFLDALRLVADSLNKSLAHALKDRGGVNEVRRRSSGHPTHFGIKMEFNLPKGEDGFYAFRVGSQSRGGFEVQREECRVYGPGLVDEYYYVVEAGDLKGSHAKVMPASFADRLYLVAASGVREFRPVYDALTHMGFYNLNPDVIRELQKPDTGELLQRDGGNLAAVIEVMAKEHRDVLDRALEFLSEIVPGLTSVEVKHIAHKETIEFRQIVGTNKNPWRFHSENMSDGTLRALGVLVALFQTAVRNERRVPLIGIEEPETAVHPGAAGVLRDALIAASASTQVLVTSHSPDLLDDKDVKADWIQGVANENGETKIGPIDKADRSVIRDRLFTAGELLKRGQLTPDPEQLKKTTPSQLELFARSEV